MTAYLSQHLLPSRESTPTTTRFTSQLLSPGNLQSSARGKLGPDAVMFEAGPSRRGGWPSQTFQKRGRHRAGLICWHTVNINSILHELYVLNMSALSLGE